MSEPRTITTNRVNVDLLRMQRDTVLEILAGELPKGHKSALDGIVNLLDSMLDTAELEQPAAIGPSLTEYQSSRDGTTVIHVDTPHDWPENENGPILRIYLNDDTDNPIFDNPREST